MQAAIPYLPVGGFSGPDSRSAVTVQGWRGHQFRHRILDSPKVCDSVRILVSTNVGLLEPDWEPDEIPNPFLPVSLSPPPIFHQHSSLLLSVFDLMVVSLDVYGPVLVSQIIMYGVALNQLTPCHD